MGVFQWECEAELSKHVRFDKTEVNCEGYSYPDDPNIVPGSCSLTYTLKYVPGYVPDNNNNENNYQDTIVADEKTYYKGGVKQNKWHSYRDFTEAVIFCCAVGLLFWKFIGDKICSRGHRD